MIAVFALYQSRWTVYKDWRPRGSEGFGQRLGGRISSIENDWGGGWERAVTQDLWTQETDTSVELTVSKLDGEWMDK